jgi:hypothetical protein
MQWVVGTVSAGVKQQVSEVDRLHLVLRLRIVEIYIHFLIPLHGVVLN